jgi:myosin I
MVSRNGLALEFGTNALSLGWWLMKRGNEEGWAPWNYLELVPVEEAPPPPVRRHAPPPVAKPAAASKPAATLPSDSNGSSQPSWRQSTASASTSSNANKPAPKPPVAASKPASSRAGGKPPVPSAPRPPVGGAKPAVGAVRPQAAPAGQMDLAAMVSVHCLDPSFIMVY